MTRLLLDLDIIQDELANWVICSERHGKVFLDAHRYLGLKVHRSRHSEPSYGKCTCMHHTPETFLCNGMMMCK